MRTAVLGPHKSKAREPGAVRAVMECLLERPLQRRCQPTRTASAQDLPEGSLVGF
jgi:hypothetical protein